MKATVVGLVSPHVLHIMDLAKTAETGANVDWHLRDAVAKSAAELGQQYNARDLLAAYIQGLETAAGESERTRKFYAGALRTAARLATSKLAELD